MLKQLFLQKNRKVDYIPLTMFLRCFEDFIALRSAQTARQYRGIIRELLAYYDLTINDLNTQLPKITREDATDYVKYIGQKVGQVSRVPGVSKGATKETIRRKVTILKRIWEHFQSEGLITDNPWVMPWPHRRVTRARKRPTQMIPFNLVKQILNCPGTDKKGIRDKALLSILFGAGLRRKEVASLRVGSVETSAQGTVFVRVVTKGDVVTEKPLPAWAAQAVSTLIQQRVTEGGGTHDVLFTKYLGVEKRPKGTALSESTIYRLFKGYCAEAGLDPKQFSPHCARATAITKLLTDGHEYSDVQNFAGHASIKTTQRYDKRVKDVEQGIGKKINY